MSLRRRRELIVYRQTVNIANALMTILHRPKSKNWPNICCVENKHSNTREASQRDCVIIRPSTPEISLQSLNDFDKYLRWFRRVKHHVVMLRLWVLFNIFIFWMLLLVKTIEKLEKDFVTKSTYLCKYSFIQLTLFLSWKIKQISWIKLETDALAAIPGGSHERDFYFMDCWSSTGADEDNKNQDLGALTD